MFHEKYEMSKVLSNKRSNELNLECLKHLIPKTTFYTVMVLLLMCICLYGSRCSKSFLGSHFCMQKRIIHSYYIFLLFFFCYQLFKLSFTAYLLSKYLEDNVRNFFIYMNLNKKVVLKIIKQRKDLILYH